MFLEAIQARGHRDAAPASIRRALAVTTASAALALGAVAPAGAADPVNGRSLYTADCASCHGASPLTTNSNKIYFGRNSATVISNSIGNVGDMQSLRSRYPAGGAALQDLAAYLGNSPSALSFASTAVGSTSAAQTVTVAASLKAGYAISGLVVTTSGDFVRTGGTCASGVATGTSCTITVAFAPTASGARSGTLSIAHSGVATPVTIALSGSATGGAAPVVSLAPASLVYAQALGGSSAAQTATVSNTGTAALTLSAISVGGAQASEFGIVGGTCAAGSSVAAGSSCTVRVAFTPAATGTRTAALNFAHNASGSPSAVALSGTGTAAAQPVISANAASLGFGTVVVGTLSATKQATVKNTGAAPLTLGSFTTGGIAPLDFKRSGSCKPALSLAPNTTCTVRYAFQPTATGTRRARLTIASDASNGNLVLALAGTGAATGAPAVTLSAATLDFGNQSVGVASAVHRLTLKNTGSDTLALSGIGSTAPFSTTHNCGTAVAPGGSCRLSVVFTPTATGAATGSLTITSNAASSPNTVTLAGSGVALAGAVVLAAPTSSALAFPETDAGNRAAPQSVTVENQGPTAVTLTRWRFSGAQAADFSADARSGCAVGQVLPVQGRCSLEIAFHPAAAGERRAQLQVLSTGSATPALELSGSGMSSARPAAAATPPRLRFAADDGAPAGDRQPVMLQSTGHAPLSVRAIDVAGRAFALQTAATDACPPVPFELPPGERCALDVVRLGAERAAPGRLVITTNAPETTLAVPLTTRRASPDDER